jgi:hypothetical protein
MEKLCNFVFSGQIPECLCWSRDSDTSRGHHVVSTNPIRPSLGCLGGST